MAESHPTYSTHFFIAKRKEKNKFTTFRARGRNKFFKTNENNFGRKNQPQYFSDTQNVLRRATSSYSSSSFLLTFSRRQLCEIVVVKIPSFFLLLNTASIKRTIHPTDWNSEMLGNEAFVGTTTKKERKPSRRDRPTDATRTPTENG